MSKSLTPSKTEPSRLTHAKRCDAIFLLSSSGAHLESVRARGRPSKAPDQPPAFIDATPRELYGSLDHLAALATAAVGEAPDGGRFLEPVPPPKDPFWCPMRDCDKQYKQLAGESAFTSGQEKEE